MATSQTKLTPERSARILAMVRIGNFIEVACRANGITARTLRNWVKRGQEGRAPYRAFLEQLAVADAECEAAMVAILHQAATTDRPGDWRAKAWMAERRLRRNWGQKIRVQVDSAIEDLLKHLRERLEPELYQRVCDAIADFSDRAEGAAQGLAGEFAELERDLAVAETSPLAL